MSTHSQDPIVIVGAARTPMGSFQSDFASQSAHDLGGVAIKAAVERAGVKPELVDEVLFGNCLMAGQGQAPARQAALKGGLPLVGRRRHPVQNVRLGHEGHHAGARHAARRQRHGDGVGRHGEHDQRAVPHAQGPRRLPHGPRQDLRPHDARRPGRRLRSRPLHGHLRRRLRRQIQLHPRAARCLRHRLGDPRQGRHRERCIRHRNRPRDGERPQRRARDRDRRRSGQGQARQNPQPEARLQKRRRHHHRRLQLVHQRRRCRPGVDARVHRQGPGIETPGPHRGPQHPRPGAQLVRHRAGGCHAESCWPKPAGPWAMWTCGRSTKPLPWCPWR